MTKREFHIVQCKAALAESASWGPALYARKMRAYWQHMAAFHRQELQRLS